MKKFGFILGLLVIAASLVATGWWLGLKQRVLTEAYAIGALDKQLVDASMNALIIHQLDSGQLSDARQMLQLKLDGEILMVDSLIDDGDTRSRELARKVFARIATYRAEHPADPNGISAQSSGDVDAKIADILRRAKEEQKK